MFQELRLGWAALVTHTYHAQLGLPCCDDALKNIDIKIGASDFENREPGPEYIESEQSEPDDSNLEEPDPEESTLEESEPEESEIQALILVKQEMLKNRQRAEQEMASKMFQELRCGPGQWEYKLVE